MSRVYVKKVADAVKDNKMIHTRTLSFSDNILYSYNTPIGFFSSKKNTFVLITLKGKDNKNENFSPTTANQINQMQSELNNLNIPVKIIAVERSSHPYSYKDTIKTIIRKFENEQ